MTANTRGFLVLLASEARWGLTHGPAWVVVAATLALSLLAVLVPGHPFAQAGTFSLSSFSGLDQLVVTLLACMTILGPAHGLRQSWWPLGPGTRVAARVLGGSLGWGLLVLCLVAGQYATAFLAGELQAVDPLTGEPGIPLDGRYAQLLAACLLMLLVLVAWAQLLITLLGRAGGVLTLLVLVLAGFLISTLWGAYPPLRWFLFLLPDLSSLAPVTAAAGDRGLGARTAGYAAAHAGCVVAMTAVILRLGWARSRPSWKGWQEP